MLAFDKETQQRIFQVAEDRAQGKKIGKMDERIAFVMDMHPEFDAVWPQGEMVAAIPQEIKGQIVNPFVHTMLHAIVDKQLEDENPEFVAETHRRLLQEGLEDHESLHVIISIFADLYFTSVRRGGGQFDYLEYESRLERVSVSPE
jgi:hypothetical protein